jgi:three-Cys-motif partner protein
MMAKADLYIGREQTLVKHFILERYLERFAHIVGTVWNTITYIDCFSGPWNVKSENLADSSFAIALQQLRNARDTHRARGRDVRLRCYFLEKDAKAYAKLRKFADKITDVEIETRNAALEDSVTGILEFVQRGETQSFPFIFIDPTGWTGFEMGVIAPLLRLDPGEVLINFMIGHIRRFIESPQAETQESFERLFGSGEFKQKIQGLAQHDREDAAVFEYARNVKSTGRFNYVCPAIVLHPEIDRTHFNLIYATRNPKGIEVFKEAEKKAMEVMEAARSEARLRKREERTRQAEMFSAQVLRDSSYYDSLRERHLAECKDMILRMLSSKKSIVYDEVWVTALTQPLIWESDLKEWINDWRAEGRLAIEGMGERQRVPHRGEGNVLVWK